MLKFFIPCLVTLIIGITACTNYPTDAQLSEWHKEAVARNAQMMAVHAKQAKEREWKLVIQGQTKSGESVRLSWQQLQTWANMRVRTRSPFKTSQIEGILDFRGIPVSTLLDKFVADRNSEVTFVAFDAYRATISLEDLRRYPITLALEKNGKPISRSEGGPLFLVFPQTQYPELQKKYQEGFWVFYVTNMIIGTEPAILYVGGRALDLIALDKLPQVTIEEGVGYSMAWPSGKVKLHGVRVRDILSAAGVKLPSNGAVVVRGKAPIYRDDANPVRLGANVINTCDILLATRWGSDRQPIPAKMGGPLTLAFETTCQSDKGDRGVLTPPEQRWVTFVEELEVAAP